MKPHVAITGATSFTGLWIARCFSEKNWKISAQASQPFEAYVGLRRIRAGILRQSASVRWDLKVEGFADWIEETRPQIWVHHHHFMEKFRAQDYDIGQAIEVGLKPLSGIVDALKKVKCKGIVFSGSFFEPGEGGALRTSEPTPYAESKKQVWDELEHLSHQAGIPLSKMVIPNPIGPFENEDRLIPQMIEKSKNGEALVLGAPRSVSDQLPVETLAQGYFSLAEELMHGKTRVARPSGWICRVEELVRTVNAELIVKRLGLPACPVEMPEKPGIATTFVNPQSEVQSIDWNSIWDHYAKWVKHYPI